MWSKQWILTSTTDLIDTTTCHHNRRRRNSNISRLPTALILTGAKQRGTIQVIRGCLITNRPHAAVRFIKDMLLLLVLRILVLLLIRLLSRFFYSIAVTSRPWFLKLIECAGSAISIGVTTFIGRQTFYRIIVRRLTGFNPHWRAASYRWRFRRGGRWRRTWTVWTNTRQRATTRRQTRRTVNCEWCFWIRSNVRLLLMMRTITVKRRGQISFEFPCIETWYILTGKVTMPVICLLVLRIRSCFSLCKSSFRRLRTILEIGKIKTIIILYGQIFNSFFIFSIETKHVPPQ